MSAARFVCSGCGATSPAYTGRTAALAVGRLRKSHVCGNTCPACNYRTIQRGCRGLCLTCHQDPEIRIDYETQFWRADDLLDAWDELRREGYTLTAAAERLGIKRDTLDTAIRRAGKRGDPRAKRSAG